LRFIPCHPEDDDTARPFRKRRKTVERDGRILQPFQPKRSFMRKLVICVMTLLCTCGAAPSSPLGDLQFLIGTWRCSYASGSQHGVYTASYAPALNGSGLLQTDSWNGGGGDAAIYSYQAATRRVNVTVVEENGETTVFLGTPAGGRIAYRSVYPDSTAKETFERVTGSEYTLGFTQTQHGKTIASKDVCVRTPSR
jgi:hypothetical protein